MAEWSDSTQGKDANDAWEYAHDVIKDDMANYRARATAVAQIGPPNLDIQSLIRQAGG